MEAAKALAEIKGEVRKFSNLKFSKIPLIADIHFDYRLALTALESGADQLRINPANIGGEDRIRKVAEAAKSAGIPIRVGINGGCVEKEIIEKYNGITAEGLCESVMHHVRMLEAHDFYNMELAIKTSNVPLTVEACRLLSEQSDYPMHIGITEAGTPYRGTIKSAVGIGTLLAMGIGDTIRVSLTGNPVEEIRVAKEILQVMGLRQFGAQVISCPTCGRCCDIDLLAMVQEVEDYCATISKPITVAVMGCVVNGPGEAREADFGIACGKGQGVIFQKGEIVEKVPESQLAKALIKKIAEGTKLPKIQSQID
jgi:(E)-4-hydroxy-3-methylbut-2-enyl-diphosphate synthase